jgi:hypothetical protein
VESRCNKLGEGTDLPAGIIGKSRDLHSVRSSTRSRRRTLVPHAALSVSSSTGKLDGEAFSHKVGSICIVQSRVSLDRSERGDRVLAGKGDGGQAEMVGRWTYGKLYMATKNARLVSIIDPVANLQRDQG